MCLRAPEILFRYLRHAFLFLNANLIRFCQFHRGSPAHLGYVPYTIRQLLRFFRIFIHAGVNSFGAGLGYCRPQWIHKRICSDPAVTAAYLTAVIYEAAYFLHQLPIFLFVQNRRLRRQLPVIYPVKPAANCLMVILNRIAV